VISLLIRVFVHVDGSLVVGTRRKWRKMVLTLLRTVVCEIGRVRASIVSSGDGTACAGVTVDASHGESR